MAFMDYMTMSRNLKRFLRVVSYSARTALAKGWVNHGNLGGHQGGGQFCWESRSARKDWIPACAGMNKKERVLTFCETIKFGWFAVWAFDSSLKNQGFAQGHFPDL
jgi:hypothetical protein